MSKGILIGILGILVVGLIAPYFLSFFININSVSSSPLVEPGLNLIDNGVSFGNITLWGVTVVPEVSLNPFNLLGTSLKTYLHDSVNMISILPDKLIAFLMIVIIVMIATGLLKLIRG